MRLNRLKAPTWNRLQINDITIEEDITINSSGRCAIEKVPSGLIIGNESCADCNGCPAIVREEIGAIKGGMGQEADVFFEKASPEILMVRAREGRNIPEPLNIRYLMEKGDSNADRVEIIAEEGSSLTVIMDYTSSSSTASGFFGIQTRISVKKGASVHLVKVNLLGRQYLCLDDTCVRVEEGGSFDITQMLLGGGRSIAGLGVDLSGRRASFNGDTAYLCLGDQMLDMNCHIDHHGKGTVSELKVSGALRDKASKTFRGTIDLIRGAKGASGAEQEDVLLLSDDVINKTLPVILCDEDDVEGAHGATIGRLSPETLFYMQSRGISEREAELIMTKAKLNAVRHLIGDEYVNGRIQYYLEEVFG